MMVRVYSCKFIILVKWEVGIKNSRVSGMNWEVGSRKKVQRVKDETGGEKSEVVKYWFQINVN